MPYAQGMRQTILLMGETSFKTLPGTVTADKVPVINPSFRPTRNKFSSQALTGSPEPRAVVTGKIGVEWDCEAECNPSSMMPWMKYTYGANGWQVNGTTGLYHHRFNLADLGSFGAEDGHADLTKFLGYRGLYVGSSALSFAAEGVMSARVSGLGGKALASAGATVVNGTITDRTILSPFSYLYGRVKKGGSTIGYVKMATFEINRGLDKDVAQDETNEIAVIFSQVATINGSITALFSAPTLYDDALAGGDTSLEFFVPYGQGQAFIISIPTAKFTPFKVTTNGTGLVTLEGGYDAQGNGATKGSVRSLWFSTLGIAGLNLLIKVDGGAPQTITFAGGDDTPDEAVTTINATLTGAVARVERMAGETGGVVVIESNTTGTTSSIEVQAASTADALMGIDNNVHSGLSNVSHEAWLLNKVAA